MTNTKNQSISLFFYAIFMISFIAMFISIIVSKTCLISSACICIASIIGIITLKNKNLFSKSSHMRQDNYELLGLLSSPNYEEKIKPYLNKSKTIIIKQYKIDPKFEELITERNIILTKYKNHVIKKYDNNINYYDISKHDSLIGLYKHLKETEFDFKIYHEAELNQKIEFLIHNKKFFKTEYMHIENSDKLRKTYIQFKMDLFNALLNYIEEKNKISLAVIKKEKESVQLQMKKEVNTELMRAGLMNKEI